MYRYRQPLLFCFYVICSIPGLNCAKTKEKPMNVHREAPYRFITYSSEGITLTGVIGFKDTNKLVEGGIEKETESVFQHTQIILERHGSSLEQVYSIQINLLDMNDTQIVDDIFQKYFQEPYPEKTIKQVTKLPLEATIEADISATMTLEQWFKHHDKDDSPSYDD